MENCPADIKTPQEWQQTARSLAKERAAQRNGEAMQQLFMMTGQYDWLIKAAQSGFPVAQEWIGSLYKEGVGTFLIP
ncbi:sel1 repeat family protein, partial [Pseudomonas sp. RTI1]|nr:sel1 repeat family protein [Pseudomonas sp. RTI1]